MTGTETGNIMQRHCVRRLAGVGLDAALVVVWSIFLYSHARRVFVDGVYTSVPFAVENVVLLGISLARRSSTTTSSRWNDWVVASIGAWGPLLLRSATSANGTIGVIGTAVQTCGLSVTVLSFLTLGRSFGIVAANRGLKVHGPYSLVRHPVYLGHSITMTGFVVANFSVLNLLLLGVITCAQVLRIHAEERVLREGGGYGQYASRVRWRLVPGLY